jgi:hypothetical protein
MAAASSAASEEDVEGEEDDVTDIMGLDLPSR